MMWRKERQIDKKVEIEQEQVLNSHIIGKLGICYQHA